MMSLSKQHLITAMIFAVLAFVLSLLILFPVIAGSGSTPGAIVMLLMIPGIFLTAVIVLTILLKNTGEDPISEADGHHIQVTELTDFLEDAVHAQATLPVKNQMAMTMIIIFLIIVAALPFSLYLLGEFTRTKP